MCPFGASIKTGSGLCQCLESINQENTRSLNVTHGKKTKQNQRNRAREWERGNCKVEYILDARLRVRCASVLLWILNGWHWITKLTVFKSPKTAAMFPPATSHEVRPGASFKNRHKLVKRCLLRGIENTPIIFAACVLCRGGPARDAQISDVGCVVQSRAQSSCTSRKCLELFFVAPCFSSTAVWKAPDYNHDNLFSFHTTCG